MERGTPVLVVSDGRKGARRVIFENCFTFSSTEIALYWCV